MEPGETISLKEYFEALRADDRRAVDAAFAAQKAGIDAALAAADRAVLKAEAAAEKRFESVNEFRNTLADQQRTLMPRPEADAEFRAIREKMDAMATRLDKSEGKGSGLKDGWSYLIAAVGFLALIISIWKR